MSPVSSAASRSRAPARYDGDQAAPPRNLSRLSPAPQPGGPSADWLRRKLGLTQEAAFRCKMSTRLLQRIEGADVNTTLTTL
ncbi:MAG: hypothetical protein V3T05_13935, partial [Myxococcota bacterium]